MSADEEVSQAASKPREGTPSGRRARDVASVTTRSADPSSYAPQAAQASAPGPPVRDPERYEVICEHGRGGLGRVSRVHDKELGRDVAVKELLARGPISELRFAREARITARLEHPGIVPVYEAGRWPDGTPFYAMKLVSGQPLRALIAERETVDERIGLLHHVIAVADAMAYAHGRNIIHRDLKPANVIVGEFGETVVIDWGLAKDLSDATTIGGDGSHASSDHDLTKAGSVLGTPAYMAPEQERGEAVDQRADVFAIGAMLWELCSLHKVPPLDRRLRHRLLRRAGIGDDLAAILDKAIDPEPSRRYRDAGELATDLKAFKSGARIAAREYSLVALLANWTRRHRLLAMSATVILGLTIVSVVALAVLYRSSSDNAAIAGDRLVHSYEDQGRRSLLQGRHTESLVYLTEAARRGDVTESVAFMLARAATPLRAEVLRLPSLSSRAWSATFSKDGRRILTGGDGGGGLWDAQTGRRLLGLPHPGSMSRSLYTPDEAQIVTLGSDGLVRIWRTTDGALVRVLSPVRGEVRNYWDGRVSPDGQFIAAMDQDHGAVDVWRIDDGTHVLGLGKQTHRNAELSFSHDGNWLAAVADDQVAVIDTQTWHVACSVATRHVHAVAFDPIADRIATGSDDGDVILWQVPHCTRIDLLLHGASGISRVRYSPDGTLLALNTQEEILTWNMETHQLQARFTTPRRGGTGWIEFDRTSRLVATGGYRGRITVSDARSGVAVVSVEGGEAHVVDGHFDATSRYLVGALLDGTTRVWAVSEQYRRWSSLEVGRDCGTDVMMEEDHRFLAVSCDNHTTRVWDTATDRLIAELPAVTKVDSLARGPYPAVTDSGELAAIVRGEVVDVYDLASGGIARTVRHLAAVSAVRFVGKRLLTASTDGTLEVSSAQETRTFKAASAIINAVDALDDGRILVADRQPELRIYGPGSTEPAVTLRLPGQPQALRVSRDGRRLIVISLPNPPVAPLLIDLEHGRVLAQLVGHRTIPYSARFVRGDREIITAGTDGMIKLWDARTGLIRQTFAVTDWMLFDAALSPDGSLIVSAGGDGSLGFWDASTGRQLWSVRAHRTSISGVHFEGRSVVSRGFFGDLARWEIPTTRLSAEALARYDHLAQCGPWRLEETSGDLVPQSPAACEPGTR